LQGDDTDSNWFSNRIRFAPGVRRAACSHWPHDAGGELVKMTI